MQITQAKLSGDMKLYHIPSTRSVRPRWLLEEMNINYELVLVTMEMSRQPEYKKLHPHGKVPVLVDGDVIIYESAAICAYLADRYFERGFAPSLQSSARAYYYQWLFYAPLTIEAPVEQYMFHVLPNLPEKLLPKNQQTHVSEAEALAWFAKVCEPLNEHLKNHEYLVENRLTAADVVTGGVLVWAFKLGMMKDETPAKAYVTKLMERPAFQRADAHVHSEGHS